MNSLDSMLLARSLAVVGASERPGSVGDQVVRQLISGGFDGPIYLVNPRYETLHGLRCVPDLESVGDAVDLVVLAVANTHLEEGLTQAAKIGAGSAAIFASCHGEAEDGTSLRARLHQIAEDAAMPICGGNGMGFLNVEAGLRVCGFYQPPDLVPGGVTFLSHSGSLFSALLHNRRGIRFNLVVSTGLEINTPMDRYLDWSLRRASTRVVALFLETIRDPDGFKASLEAAAVADIPVVALKVGASVKGQRAVATHSEALAGDDAVYEAVFDAYGVHRVWSMDEMADTLELLSTGRRATAFGLGAVHDSGGERAMLIDTADRVGVPLPQLGKTTSDRISEVLDPGLEPANPVDAWGTGRDAEEVFAVCLDALAEDPGVGAVAFCVDLTPEELSDGAYSHAALEAALKTEKPVMVLGNLTSTIDPLQAGRLRESGIPVLEGTVTGLQAVRHLLNRYRRNALPGLASRLTAHGDPSSGSGGQISALDVLAAYGIPTPAARAVASEQQAMAAALEIGYPVVLKTAPSIDHKTESGGVVLGIVDEPGLRGAYREISDRLGVEAIVSETVPSGVEIGLGMISDPQFGPVVILAAGGTLIEIFADRVALLPPVDMPRAMAALYRLTMSPLFDGVRGRPPVNIAALAEVVTRFSELALDVGDRVAAIDVNPVIAGPDRAVAVDALIKARA
jgi:acyl-CoA synthetase (NDP forming)